MIWLALYKLSRALDSDPAWTVFVVGLLAMWIMFLLAGGMLAWVWGKEAE